MTMTVTAERGQTFEVWTTIPTDKGDYKVYGTESAYVRPTGMAPDGMYIPVELVQQLLDDDLVWVNEAPDGSEDDLYDLGLMGEDTDSKELRNLREIEERIYQAFLTRVDAAR